MKSDEDIETPIPRKSTESTNVSPDLMAKEITTEVEQEEPSSEALPLRRSTRE